MVFMMSFLPVNAPLNRQALCLKMTDQSAQKIPAMSQLLNIYVLIRSMSLQNTSGTTDDTRYAHLLTEQPRL
jgi:hypothetical protein